MMRHRRVMCIYTGGECRNKLAHPLAEYAPSITEAYPPHRSPIRSTGNQACFFTTTVHKDKAASIPVHTSILVFDWSDQTTWQTEIASQSHVILGDNDVTVDYDQME